MNEDHRKKLSRSSIVLDTQLNTSWIRRVLSVLFHETIDLSKDLRVYQVSSIRKVWSNRLLLLGCFYSAAARTNSTLLHRMRTSPSSPVICPLMNSFVLASWRFM